MFEINKKVLISSLLALLFMIAVCIYGDGQAWWVVITAGLYFLIKSTNPKLPEKLNFLWFAILLVASSVFTEKLIQFLILDAEYRAKTSDAKHYLNILICAGIFLALNAIIGRFTIAMVTGFSIMMAFAYTDYFVYLFRGNEIIFSDWKSVGTGLSVASEYTFTLNNRATLVLLIVVVYIAFIRKFPLKMKPMWLYRLLCVSATVFVVVQVATKSDGTNVESWQQKGSYRNGFLLNFVLSIRDSIVEKPEDYSLELIEELESEYETDVTEDAASVSEDAPTVIVIMDESFADLSVIGDLETSEEVMPFISSMDENVIKGYALSSVFGAKTPNSEWEFLTGNSMAWLPTGSVVYQQYIDEEPYSLVDVMTAYGYECVSFHPYYETGWSRNTVYPLLGFTESYFLDDFPQDDMVRDYVSDQEMFDLMIERFEEKEEGESLFLFGVTMQNHGGYTESYDNFTATVTMTNGYYSDVNQYLTVIHETDQAVENLITYFENVDEPVIIVFYGDHQPSLQSAFYQQLNGVGLSGLTTEQLEDLFKVPFFIWTNYESETEEIECTSFNYLASMMLERAGLPLPAYSQFLLDMQEVIPAMNSRAYYSLSENAFIHYTDAEGEEAEWLAWYQSLQYNAMFDTDNLSDVFFGQYLREDEE